MQINFERYELKITFKSIAHIAIENDLKSDFFLNAIVENRKALRFINISDHTINVEWHVPLCNQRFNFKWKLIQTHKIVDNFTFFTAYSVMPIVSETMYVNRKVYWADDEEFPRKRLRSRNVPQQKKPQYIIIIDEIIVSSI